MVLYNRRYGQQCVVMNLVTFTDDAWTVHYEGMMYDPNTTAERPEDIESGVETFAGFQFGFPTAIRPARWDLPCDALVARGRQFRHQVDALAGRLVAGSGGKSDTNLTLVSSHNALRPRRVSP